MKLSTVILTKNEEKKIGRAIESTSFADEIIVVDDFSSDRTVEVAKEMGATIYQKELDDDFSAQRNFGLHKSRGEWVLFLDADEFLTSELQKEIKEIIKKKANSNSYYIKRRDFMWGREVKYGEVKNVRYYGLIRLVKRNSGKWTSPVHETFKSLQPSGKLQSFIDHYPHQTIKEFLKDINFYSTLRALELYRQGKKPSFVELVLFPLGKFKLNYFIKRGFLDGPVGFLYAFMMSFHSFLVRAKLYQYTKLNAHP